MNVHRVLSYIHCAVAIFSFQCNLTVLWNWWLFQISIFHQLQLIMINFHEIHIVALFLSLRTLVRSKWSWEQFMSINPLLRSWFASCLGCQGHKPNQFELCICFRCCSKISSVPIRLWVLLVTIYLLPKALKWSDEQPRLVDDGGERHGLGCVVPLIASVTIPLPLSFNLGKLSGTFCAFCRGWNAIYNHCCYSHPA